MMQPCDKPPLRRVIKQMLRTKPNVLEPAAAGRGRDHVARSPNSASGDVRNPKGKNDLSRNAKDVYGNPRVPYLVASKSLPGYAVSVPRALRLSRQKIYFLLRLDRNSAQAYRQARRWMRDNNVPTGPGCTAGLRPRKQEFVLPGMCRCNDRYGNLMSFRATGAATKLGRPVYRHHYIRQLGFETALRNAITDRLEQIRIRYPREPLLDVDTWFTYLHYYYKRHTGKMPAGPALPRGWTLEVQEISVELIAPSGGATSSFPVAVFGNERNAIIAACSHSISSGKPPVQARRPRGRSS